MQIMKSMISSYQNARLPLSKGMLVRAPNSSVQACGDTAGTNLDSSEVLSRLQLLQSHLCGYAQRAVPVVNLDLANFNDTLDDLHDYLLLCIQMALEEDEAHDQTVLAPSL